MTTEAATKTTLERVGIAADERNRPQPNPWDAACPSRHLLGLIGDKWTLLLLPLLAGGPVRNGELMRHIGGVSQKMLTQTLRELERNGLVARRDYGEVPPKVDYQLTPLGRSLYQAVYALDKWVVTHFHETREEKCEGVGVRASGVGNAPNANASQRPGL